MTTWLSRRLLCMGPAILRETRGAAAIEFAMIVPIVMLLGIGTIDLGMGLYRSIQVVDAAHAGAGWAIRNGFDANAISNAELAATSASITVSPAPAKFCGCPNGDGIGPATCGTLCREGMLAGTYTTVSAQLTYHPILNYGIFQSTYNLTSQSTVRLQ